MSKTQALLACLFIAISLGARDGQLPARGARGRVMTLSEAIEFVRPSVVQILVAIDRPAVPNESAQVPGMPGRIPLGTGLMVNADGYVITAGHVAEALREIQVAGQKRLLVGLAIPNLENFKVPGGPTLSIRGSFVLTDCDIVDEDSRHDLALLKMKRNPFKGEMGTFIKSGDRTMDYPHKVATLSPGRPADGENIAVSGYPFSNTVLVTTSGSVASSWTYETVDVQVPGAPAWFRRPDTADSYLADMHVNPGNSGGPVYSIENGMVIGVCVGFDMAPVIYGDGAHEPVGVGNRPLEYNSGLSVVVPIRYAIDLLKKNNLKWHEAAER